MSGELEKLLIRLEADTTQLRRALQQADSAVSNYAGNTDRKLSQTERRFASMARTVKGAIGGLAIGYAIKEAGELADTYTRMSNRLAVVAKSAGDLELVQRRLFEISQEARVDLADTTDLYARYAFALKDAGVTTNEVLEFTESLSKAVTVSGASASEASGALRQLSQGLAAGVLRGEELNSILEQLPIVADLIAQKMGVTTGELKKLGEQGLITRKNVFDALIEGSAQLDASFQKTQPTISQGLTQIGNSLLEFIGVADRATGVSSWLGSALSSLAGKISGGAKSLKESGLGGLVGGNVPPPGVDRFSFGAGMQGNIRGQDKTPAALDPWAASVIPVSAEEQLKEMKDAWDELHEAQMNTLDDLIGDKTETAATKMAALTEAVRKGEIGWRDYADGVVAVGDQTARVNDAMLSSTSNFLDTMFAKNKAAATASALINTYQGVTKALSEYPPPFSYAMAAMQAAMGFAQVRSIQSTNKTSSGGGSAAGLSAAAGSAGATQQAAGPSESKTMHVQLSSLGDMLGRKGIRSLLENIQEAQRDGFTLSVGR